LALDAPSGDEGLFAADEWLRILDEAIMTAID
jgi:hypothetical protein